MSFLSKKSGCPMCSIVSRATAASGRPQSPPHSAPSSPTTPISSFSAGGVPSSRPRAGKGRNDEPEIIWHDENFTVYSERAHPVSSVLHLVIIFNLHVPSLYMLSTSDVPLLVQLQGLAYRLLTDLTSQSGPLPSSSASPSPSPSSAPPETRTSPTFTSTPAADQQGTHPRIGSHEAQFRVGFITPPWKDIQIPVKDHLHAHAYVAPMDRCSWWRSIAYSPLAWYAIDDLIAEIREESSNNRIRSTGGTSTSSKAHPRPIDRVPNAGARSGTADGYETTTGGLAPLMVVDLESGDRHGHEHDHHHNRYSSARSSTSSNNSNSRGYGYGYDHRSPPEAPSSSTIPLKLTSPGAGLGAGASSRYDSRRLGYTGVASGSGSQASSSRSSLVRDETYPGSSLVPTGSLLSPTYAGGASSFQSSSS